MPTTPGTRLKWTSLKEWIDAARQIQHRACSSKTDADRTAHVAALAEPLGLFVIEYELNPAVLHNALAEITEEKHTRPPRGQRAGHPSTTAIVALKNQLARLERNRGPPPPCFEHVGMPLTPPTHPSPLT